MTVAPPTPQTSLGRYSRRFILAGGAIIAGGGVAHWFNIGGNLDGASLSVTDAHAGAVRGDFILVDIRRPDEWSRTGVPQGATALDMRDPEFMQKLLLQVSGRDAPIALICARGVRSRSMANALRNAGFTNIIDVPEGMLGSGAGPGWLSAGLPVTQF